MATAPAIETRHLTKKYRNALAVCDLHLLVPRGCVTAFLGCNGAGKSTTIKMALGMVRPTAGETSVLGTRVSDIRASCRTRQRIAYVAENKPLYGYMTPEQLMRFASSFYADWRPEVAAKLLGEYALPPDRKVKSLSKGMRTKLALLLALARRPDLLILDEPSEGLDPVGIEHLLQTIAVCSAEGVTVFFSSHQIAEVERVADRICILDKGRLLLNASLDDLRESYRCIDVTFPSVPFEREFQISGVEKIRTSGRQMRVLASRNAEAVVERAQQFHAVSIDVAPVSLRDIFLQTVQEG